MKFDHELDRLIAFNKVQELVGGISQPTIWRMRRAGTFPQPVKISPNRIAWRESDVRAWIDSRASADLEALDKAKPLNHN